MEIHFPRQDSADKVQERKGKERGRDGKDGDGSPGEDFIPDNKADRLIVGDTGCSSFGFFVHQKLHHRPDLFTAW